MPLTAYTSATTMVDLTWTQTITITSTLGPIPTTTTVLFTTTEMPESTLTDSTTTLEATTTATTDMPVSTLCAASMPVQQIGIASDGGKVEIVTAIASANDCCLACFMPGPSQPPGCGAWQFDAAAGGVCQIASGAKGPDASVNGQCPAGSGRYIVVGGGAFIGGDGPCSGGHYSGVTAPPS
ncbi:hypothetical protein C8R46DRAFT_1083095 [Mycena filopes]|nr:hypothetical protein C8R46DRAFT_1083095 [Mycena filopes]